MDRLQTEIERLYLTAPGRSLVDAQGGVRALVLEGVQPAGWRTLAAAWQGVQAELELPAPAIAVSGLDGLQLWFSLAQPVPAARGHAFLAALRARFLAEVPAAGVRLWPDAATPPRHASLVPALQAATGNWSAFVSPDLAAVFSDTPWLDIEPGDEGQAALLRGLRPIEPAAFDAAMARLGADAPDAPATPSTGVPGPASAPGPAERSGPGTPAAAASGPSSTTPATAPEDDPRRFLRRVMNDDAVPLALRIEAAKALLAGE